MLEHHGKLKNIGLRLMTLNDFLKRVKDSQKDKMMILVDENGGWANANVEIDENYIKILPDYKPLFSND